MRAFPRYKQLIAELRDEAGRIAANIAKLPEHVTKRQTQTEQGPPVKLGLAIKRTPRSLHVRGFRSCCFNLGF